MVVLGGEPVVGEVGGAQRVVERVPQPGAHAGVVAVRRFQARAGGIAHPDHVDQGRGPAQRPVRREELGGPGLGAHPAVGEGEVAVGAEGRVAVGVVAGDLGDDEGRVGGDHPVALVLGVERVEHLAARVGDAHHRGRVVVDAHVGDGADAVRHLQRADAVGEPAEGGGELVRLGPVLGVLERGEPGGDLEVGDGGDAHRRLGLHRGDVVGVPQAAHQRADAVVAVVVVVRRVAAVRAVVEADGAVDDRRRHREAARRDRGRVGEHLDRRSRLQRPGRHVQLSDARVVRIPGADHGEHRPVARIHAHQRAVVGVVALVDLLDPVVALLKTAAMSYCCSCPRVAVIVQPPGLM